MRRYGIDFPDGASDASIELHCYRWGASSAGEEYVRGEGMLSKGEHLYRAILLLWPERLPDGKKGYIPDEWTLPRCMAWAALGPSGMTHDVWWGPSSTGKTTTAAVIILADWLSAPDRTCTNVVSTSLTALKLRIFGEIAKFHAMHGDNLPGTVKMSDNPCIVLGDENSKNGIFGHAVNRGNQLQSMNKLIGLHNEFNRLVIDEFQGALPAASDAAVNLASGREFKFLGMGNPQSKLDPMGRHSEPVSGWESINPSMETWKTKFGTVHFFDGLKSPGVKDPKRYFFMLTQQMIDDTVAHYGSNSIQYWSQRRGWMPPEGLLPTVLTESFILKFRMDVKAVWKMEAPKLAAGFDPAFSSGGDRAIFYPFKYGVFEDGIFGMEFLEPVALELGSTSDKLFSYHLLDQLKAAASLVGVKPADIAMDCTGQQVVLADLIEKEWGPGLLRVQFGGKPSELPVEHKSKTSARDEYKNRVTELLYSMNYFGRNGQIRGLSRQACIELCQRRLVKTDSPMQVESKTDYKERTGGDSPDESDAAICALDFMRRRLMQVPGASGPRGADSEDELRILRELDVDSDPMNYLSSEL